jgi:tetratricopeptide (TPR) repeat protein
VLIAHRLFGAEDDPVSAAPVFAQLLRRFRLDAMLTQERLAELANLSSDAVKALEGGRRRYPRPTTVDQLAAALDLVADDRDRFTESAKRPKTDAGTSGPPHQLPPPISDFTGRSEHLAGLIDLLKDPDRNSPGIVISAIGGMGGIGKTTLAVHAAHLSADAFPDGQLYLNLRGASADPISTAQALDTLLQALGLAPAGATDDLAFTAARYRTALADRRLLLLLDDAASVNQILPLLPGTTGVTVVITSRSSLTNLPGAHRLALDVLTDDEALQLLAEIVGPDKVADDRDAALEVIQYCGSLPLAIRIAGSHADAAPLTLLASRLAAATGLSDVLTGPDAGVHRTLALSLDALTASTHPPDSAAATAFPALALFDGDHFPLRAAAAVLDRSLEDTEQLLERLIDTCLLETPALHHYRMHDLVQEIGRSIASSRLAPAEYHELRLRELACYSAMLWRQNELLGGPEQYRSRSKHWSAGAEDLCDLTELTAWLVAELPNIVSLVHRAATHVDQQHLAVRMTMAMPSLAASVMRFAEARSALLVIARFATDLPAEMEIDRLYATALMCGCLSLHDEGLDWLLRALPATRERGTSVQLARCLIDLGYVYGQLGRPAEGLPYAEEGLTLTDAGEGLLYRAAQLTIGVLTGRLGDLERQRVAFEDLLTPTAMTAGRALHRNLVATSFRQTGQLDLALRVLQKNRADIRQLGLETLETDVLMELGAVHLAMSDLPKAFDALSSGLQIAARYPAEQREAPLSNLLGRVLAAMNRPEEAREMWERAVMLYDRAADPRAAEVRRLLAGD